jgi:hypothetical protein
MRNLLPRLLQMGQSFLGVAGRRFGVVFLAFLDGGFKMGDALLGVRCLSMPRRQGCKARDGQIRAFGFELSQASMESAPPRLRANHAAGLPAETILSYSR